MGLEPLYSHFTAKCGNVMVAFGAMAPNDGRGLAEAGGLTL